MKQNINFRGLETKTIDVDFELANLFVGFSKSRNPEKRLKAGEIYDSMDELTKRYVETNPAISCYYRALMQRRQITKFKRELY